MHRIAQARGHAFELAAVRGYEAFEHVHRFAVAALPDQPARAFRQIQPPQQKQQRKQHFRGEEPAPDSRLRHKMQQCQGQQRRDDEADRLAGDGGHHHAAALLVRHAFGHITAADREIHADAHTHHELRGDQPPGIPGQRAEARSDGQNDHVDQKHRFAAIAVG